MNFIALGFDVKETEYSKGSFEMIMAFHETSNITCEAKVKGNIVFNLRSVENSEDFEFEERDGGVNGYGNLRDWLY